MAGVYIRSEVSGLQGSRGRNDPTPCFDIATLSAPHDPVRLFDQELIISDTTMLPHWFYRPGIGGHAPRDVRNAFLEAVQAYEAWNAGAPEPTVELRDRPVNIPAVCGLLWSCSDILPGLEQRQLEDLGIGDRMTTCARGLLQAVP